jgi:hypothetical protein
LSKYTTIQVFKQPFKFLNKNYIINQKVQQFNPEVARNPYGVEVDLHNHHHHVGDVGDEGGSGARWEVVWVKGSIQCFP